MRKHRSTIVMDADLVEDLMLNLIWQRRRAEKMKLDAEVVNLRRLERRLDAALPESLRLSPLGDIRPAIEAAVGLAPENEAA